MAGQVLVSRCVFFKPRMALLAVDGVCMLSWVSGRSLGRTDCRASCCFVGFCLRYQEANWEGPSSVLVGGFCGIFSNGLHDLSFERCVESGAHMPGQKPCSHCVVASWRMKVDTTDVGYHYRHYCACVYIYKVGVPIGGSF